MKSEVLQLSLTDIDVDDTGAYKPLEEVFIGQQAQTYLEDSDLSSAETKTFYHTCQQFWLAGASYAMVKLPLNHSLLDNLTWVYPFSNSYDKVDQVLAAAKLLPQVIRESEIGVLVLIWIIVCLRITLLHMIWQWMNTGIKLVHSKMFQVTTDIHFYLSWRKQLLSFLMAILKHCQHYCVFNLTRRKTVTTSNPQEK